MFQLKRVNEDYNEFFSFQDNTNEWRLSIGKNGRKKEFNREIRSRELHPET